MKINLLFLGGVCLLGVCCGPAVKLTQVPQAVVPRIYKGSTLPDAAALTQCDTATNTPIVVIDTSYLGTPEWNYLLVHEMKHVEQMSRYPGGCREGSKRYANDGWFRMESEIEAECAELAVKVRDGASYENGIYTLTRFFWGNSKFPTPQSFEWLEGHIREVCRKEADNVGRKEARDSPGPLS